jgi:hypothetical protein
MGEPSPEPTIAKRPMTKAEVDTLNEFLKARADKHTSHANAYEDAVNAFPEWEISLTKVRELRHAAKLKGRRGRHSLD